MTKEKFDRYVNIQKSGVTNMFDLKRVSALTGLNKEEVLDIMQNYEHYMNGQKLDHISDRLKEVSTLESIPKATEPIKS